jgi:hypothetical protein
VADAGQRDGRRAEVGYRLALRLAKTLRCWLCKLGYDQISVAGSEHEITSFAAPTLGRTIIAYQLHDPVRRINP